MKPDLTQLIEQNSRGMLLLDKDGFIEYANPAVTALTGYTPTELLNKKTAILYFTSKDDIRVEYELGMSAKTGKFVAEGWKIRKNGDQYWGVLRYYPIMENEILTGFGCVLEDTSEKKDELLALKQSEEKYRLLVDAVKDYSIFLLDPNGYIQTWNEGAQRITGYLASEITGKHFSVFYPPDDTQEGKPENELKTALDTGRYEEEGYRVKKNGSLFWANVVLTPLYNEQNKLIGFAKVTRDLSEKREKEEDLRQSEERYRSLVQQVTDYGIFMMDDKGRIISWNEGARRIKGYTEQEIMGKYFSIFYPEEDIINGKPAHELKVARSTGKYEEEGWRLKKDGSRFWANVVITAIYNPAGTLLGFSKVTRDLTERKEAERALRESYERYRELSEELSETNAELSYTNQELEQFTSIVSHDLQEPVRTIKSFLQLIDQRIGSKNYEGLESFIGKSVTAANRMKELIQNLLNYSQLSRGELIYVPVSMQEVINLALQNLKTSAENSNARIIVNIETDQVQGDKVQLTQLVQNLVSNALKFVDNITPEVKITCRRENGHPLVSVSDNGIGISKEDMSKIFEIFKRLHTKTEYPGTGIGLAICKKIVERHNGRIWLDSKEGKGTTFYFTLNE